MKKIAVAVVALAAAGCAEVDPDAFDNLNKDVTNLKMRVERLNSSQTALYEDVVAKVGNLSKNVAELDGLVRAMRASVDRMEDQVKMLSMASSQPAAGTLTTANPGTKARLEEILLEIDKCLKELSQGKIRKEEAATRLKPFAKDAVPKILDEIESSITRFEYTKQLEYVLAQFPPGELKVPFTRALSQGGVREAAARVIGSTKDFALSKILEEHLGSQDEDFRLVVGEALVHCRNAAGIPVLIQSLRSEQEASRTIAVATLKRVNRGEDFGYRSPLSVDQNAAAIKSWGEWGEKFGKTIFD